MEVVGGGDPGGLELTDEPKEYVGIIWIGDDPGIRFTNLAGSADEAATRVEARYGEGHLYTVHNEAGARRPR